MKKKKPSLQVEYGLEFGDVNASKLYDITHKEAKKKQNKKKEC
ncbi:MULTISPECIES: hypothetical protein [Bacillus]|jgi:hypothetical protein|uniref:Uncharacterized protein n=1 Tax=Bacillus smithii 7_3_47FAA TaxID=665952 RepID=G9QNT1_9BACI|nr:hypothetical protein [Bacillus smithii]AKP46633.1 hypothetical protein BSM4216_1352 [Bacillus smithii]EHL74903.1 hypothetical protein HMPREF1015_03166 [Bacillus smithii 7_3_47FAA]MED0660234.1 hypothetical protein [Bacillus smithii]MED1419617.1 hypothetical protein [Bacillus smithii]MED1455983.1 hypothetical protein [Bacillus smithii]